MERGFVKFEDLRGRVQAQFEEPGNWHWGTQFDVKALSSSLDLGVLMFCDRLQNGGRAC